MSHSHVDSISTESSPSFKAPAFTPADYEGELDKLNSVAQKAEGGKDESGKSPKKGIKRLERFEVKEAKSSGECEAQEQAEEEGEEDDEQMGPRKKPAKRGGRRKKQSSSGSEAVTRIIKKKKDDTDESDDDDDDSSEAHDVHDTMVQWVCLLFYSLLSACHTSLAGQEEEKRQSQVRQEGFGTEEGQEDFRKEESKRKKRWPQEGSYQLERLGCLGKLDAGPSLSETTSESSLPVDIILLLLVRDPIVSALHPCHLVAGC